MGNNFKQPIKGEVVKSDQFGWYYFYAENGDVYKIPEIKFLRGK